MVPGDILMLRQKTDGTCPGRRLWLFLGWEGGYALLGDPREDLPLDERTQRRTLVRVFRPEIESRDWVTLKEHIRRSA